MNNRGFRQAVALGFAAFVGVVVGLLARLFNWGSTEIYVVVAVAAAAVGALVTPFALGPLDGDDHRNGARRTG
jgi:hypothetical protein